MSQKTHLKLNSWSESEDLGFTPVEEINNSYNHQDDDDNPDQSWSKATQEEQE